MHLVCAAIEIALYTMLLAASLHLLRQALWGFRAGPLLGADPARRSPHAITVQLPLRNELAMAEGLVRSAVALEGDDVELQILDDSDDETSTLLDRLGEALRGSGVDAQVLRRPDRRGYKAGNLAYGLSRARGELVLVLDADFRPSPTLVSQLAARLDADPTLAFAQARWTFRNERTLLERLQAAILDSLFVVEQARLTAARAPVQFNGTAGLWRRAAIERAGGWATSDDALTEDLDLSLRAHEAGLRGATCPELAVSTELPADMRAFCTQQARWVRGGALTLRALGARLLRRASARDTMTIASHFVRHARQPLLVAALLRLPIVALFGIAPCAPASLAVAIVSLAIVSSGLYLAAGARRIGRPALPRFVMALPLAILSLGLAAPLSVAFVGGLLGRRGAGFSRTAKGGTSTRRSVEPLAIVVLLACAIALVLFAIHHARLGVVASLLGALGTAWVLA